MRIKGYTSGKWCGGIKLKIMCLVKGTKTDSGTHLKKGIFVLGGGDNSGEHGKCASLFELEAGDSLCEVESKLTRDLRNALI